MSRTIVITVPNYRYEIDLGSYVGPVYVGWWGEGTISISGTALFDIVFPGTVHGMDRLNVTMYRPSDVIHETYPLYADPTYHDIQVTGITYADTTSTGGINTTPTPTVTGAHFEAGYSSQDRNELWQRAKDYFDSYVPGQGVGTVTLQTKAPSQLLTFTSQRLGKSFKYWIRGNQTLELWKPTPQPSSDTL